MGTEIDGRGCSVLGEHSPSYASEGVCRANRRFLPLLKVVGDYQLVRGQGTVKSKILPNGRRLLARGHNPPALSAGPRAVRATGHDVPDETYSVTAFILHLFMNRNR